MTLYSPPTHEEGIRSTERVLSLYRITTANSIVKVNGVFTSIRTPLPALLAGLEEGVDYFLGGYEYEIPAALYDELSAAGFESGPVSTLGYGLGGYGLGPYGE